MRSINEVREYYRQALETGLPSEEGLFDPPTPAFVDALSKLTQGSFETQQLNTALDVGFGNGQYAIALARMGYDVDCVDIVLADTVKRSLDASGLAPRLRLHEMVIENFRMERVYSVVVAKDVLHFCNQDWLSSWLQRLSETAPRGALHYLSVFTDINRLDAKGRAVRLVGEADLSKAMFLSIVHESYVDGWDVEVDWREHHQHSHTTGRRYFSAWRCSVVATKGRS